MLASFTNVLLLPVQVCAACVVGTGVVQGIVVLNPQQRVLFEVCKEDRIV